MDMHPNQSPNKPNPIVFSFILAEATSILIAVAMAFTNTITESKSTFAHHFFEEPTFFHIALIYYILVNVVLSILAVVFLIWLKSKS